MIQIYGTLGPACADEVILKEMFSLGMTGVRLNLSHVTLRESAQWLAGLGRAAAAAGVRPQLLIDLQGPELRTGRLDAPVELAEGDMVSLGEEDGAEDMAVSVGSAGANETAISDGAAAVRKRVQIPLPAFVRSFCLPGQELLLDDGKLLLRVVESVPQRPPIARVMRGGILNSRKSIAFPGIPKIHNMAPTLTEADLRNIRDAKAYGVTAVMQPFVRRREDLEAVRRALDEAGGEEIRLMAKIENLDGVRQIDALIPAADEIVIARGDLGNAVPLWELPGLQRDLAQKCRQAGKPFMVVTQMLASMENNPVPTRAEVNDIFHAVLDGAASVMVTGETAAGACPAEVIRYLVNTVKSAQRYLQKGRGAYLCEKETSDWN